MSIIKFVRFLFLATELTMVLGTTSFAELFPPPADFKNEISDLRAVLLKDGTSPWKVRIANHREGNRWIFVEEGEGNRTPYSFPTKWKIEGAFENQKNRLLPLWNRKQVRRMDGSPVKTETTSYDFKQKLCRMTRRDEKGVVVLDKTIPIMDDTIPGEAIAIYFRSLPFKSGKDFVFRLFSLEPNLYTITIKNHGVEHIRTPAGEFDAYKMEIVPDVGILGIFAMFFPKVYVWHTVESPHYWVKYRGIESGINTPEIVMELTKRVVLF